MIIHFTVVTLTNSTSIFFPDGTSSRHKFDKITGRYFVTLLRLNAPILLLIERRS
jgi:hypothetical protein